MQTEESFLETIVQKNFLIKESEVDCPFMEKFSVELKRLCDVFSRICRQKLIPNSTLHEKNNKELENSIWNLQIAHKNNTNTRKE